MLSKPTPNLNTKEHFYFTIKRFFVKGMLKLNTKIGLHTYPTRPTPLHPPHHKLFEGF